MIPHSTISSLVTSATDDETHVAQILLNIGTMIRTLQFGSGLNWGTKKRRSAPPYHQNDVELYRSPPSKAAATTSPVTPLAFSPSESDHHCSKILFNKTSTKKSKKEYVGMIEDLSQRRDLLKEEIEHVTNYHSKLSAYNSQLKAMKQEALNSCPRKEDHKLESITNKNIAMELSPSKLRMSMKTETHLKPLVEDRTAEIYPTYFGPISAQLCFPNNGFSSISRVGPIRIPDLNLSAEEMDQYQPLDRSMDRRARSAEARRKRMDIIRIKSMRRSASISKFPIIR